MDIFKSKISFARQILAHYVTSSGNMDTWQLTSLNDCEKVAAELIGSFPDKRIFAFRGDMGAGKTTIIKSLCRVLGVEENTSSPTFAIVNEYRGRNNRPVYHFDFYRIESVNEAIEIGVNEYFNSGNYCFVEWPEKILHLLPEETILFRITVVDQIRLITREND